MTNLPKRQGAAYGREREVRNFAEREPPPLAYEATEYTLRTDVLAQAVDVRPQSIIKQYHLTGSYLGEIPKKGRNRYLWWHVGAPTRLKNGGGK